jgi:hypothetical protein
VRLLAMIPRKLPKRVPKMLLRTRVTNIIREIRKE